jgi:hypothetical protein
MKEAKGRFSPATFTNRATFIALEGLKEPTFLELSHQGFANTWLLLIR